MGPAASADFYRRLVDIAQHSYGADQDTDFPAMHLYSLPLRGFDETGFHDAPLIESQLVEGIQKLAASGSELIVIPCNTVHAFFETMQKATPVPILNIITAVIDEVDSRNFTRIGILSSESTRNFKLYEAALASHGKTVFGVTDEEQATLNAIVHRVMNGSNDASDSAKLSTIVARFASEGAEAVILGCTELPLAISDMDSSLPLINSTEILAKAALRAVYAA